MVLTLIVAFTIIGNIIRKYFFPNLNFGFIFHFKQQWTTIFINFLKFRQKKRLNNYVKDLSYPIEKTGLISSKQHKELEEPISLKTLKPGTIDEVSMSGFNSNGDSLILRLARKADCRTEIFLFLHLNGKGSFRLPFLPDTRAFSSEAEEFSSCGLKIKCLSAMRRWRISYNGFLQNVSADKEQELIHLKFSFIWTTISQSYDFQTDFNSSLISESICQNFSLLPYKTLDKYKKIFNTYEQWGHYMGTICIDNEEEELHLWGPRCRDRGILKWNEIADYVKIYGYFKDGMVFNLGKIDIPGTFKNLKYGYIIRPNRTVYPVESCYFDITSEEGNNVLHKLTFRAGGKSYLVECKQSNENCEALYGEKTEIRSNIQLANYTLEKVNGKGYVEFGTRNEFQTMQPLNFRYPCLLLENVPIPKKMPFVIDFNEEIGQKETVSGGKGCSLAKLCKLLNIQKKILHSDGKDKFVVPRGIVITTTAYEHHINSNNLSSKISSLQSYKRREKLEDKCKELREEFCKTILPNDIKQAISYKLKEIFSNDFENVAFAIRSSASGEDSLETSAAGQMDTYLGIRSIDQIYHHVVKCWSSQFSNVAVNYKRQMGQRINSTMAVVVQEMVPARVAGVTFTCDPLTGNPAYVTITANYGLGESVVSAASEPDTVVLRRNLDNTLFVESQTVGEKRIKIQMSDEGGTITETVVEGEAKLCCLQPEEAIKIGKVAILIEECFGNPRDIEWAIVNNDIYLLQARPITTQDLETDFEIIHELDAGHLTDSEYLTKANVGEVLPNALSPLTISTICKIMDTRAQLNFHKEEGSPYNPEISSIIIPTAFNHCFITINDFVMRKCSEEITVTSYGWQLSLFGRILDNINELHETAIHRFGVYPKFKQMLEHARLIWNCLFMENLLRTVPKVVTNNYIPEETNFASSHELYKVICQMLPMHCTPFYLHYTCTSLSSLCNAFILGVLTKSRGEINEELFSDFSKLVSDCENVESMDVPNALKSLANHIINYGELEKFIKMKPQEAAKWLEQEKSYLGDKYREFIQQHGHRGLMEFDLLSSTWSMEPTTLIKSLQAMLKGSTTAASDDKKIKSPSAIVDQLNLPIGWISKFLLKKLVTWARYAVTIREKGKSILIKSVDVYRRAYRKLGKLMEDEGRIPDSNLIFFFTHEEIGILLKTRSAHLISKALRRQKLHKTIFDLKFEEIMCGIPKPITEKVENISKTSDWTIKGTPIRHGIVTAPARVIKKFEDAENIRPGEILITYSTDIGWTPYFPMLTGIVTELGGLLSHGAVVAREFGIPCIVGARSATAIVKTGDIVILDGKSGILKKV